MRTAEVIGPRFRRWFGPLALDDGAEIVVTRLLLESEDLPFRRNSFWENILVMLLQKKVNEEIDSLIEGVALRVFWRQMFLVEL